MSLLLFFVEPHFSVISLLSVIANASERDFFASSILFICKSIADMLIMLVKLLALLCCAMRLADFV